MTRTELRALQRLAEFHGVLLDYRSVSGRKITASPETLQAILHACGVPIQKTADAPALLKQAQADYWRQPLEPVVVAWQETGGQFELRWPEKSEPVSGRIRLDSGETLELSGVGGRGSGGRGQGIGGRRVKVDGTSFVSRTIKLPRQLPLGYHLVEIEGGGFAAEARLIVAPTRAWSPKVPTRSWGVFLPLYALHSSKGAGTYSTLGELAEWTAARGGQIVSTLPLLPVFLPQHPSPYSPISKLFWNEFYVDIKAAPEWGACEQASHREPVKEGQSWVRPGKEVNYPLEYSLKRALLEALTRFFFSKRSARRSEFERWLHPEVQRYATFRAVAETRKESWVNWPEQLRQGHIKNEDFDPRVRDYYLYAQWLAGQQMAALSERSRGLGVRLYLDMPLGVHPDGYDVWRHPELFAASASGGAPPDPVFTKGQDWAFAPLHPQKIREQGYRYFIESVQHHLRHAGALRFDHVMSLHRLFWVPHGLSAAQGAYVQYRSEELYAILSLESHRHQSYIVGENLGTVPPAVNSGMRRHGLRQMFVVQYEIKPQPDRALRTVPMQTVASLNTHDMPPFAAFLQGLDVADRGALGLLTKTQILREERCRRTMNRALAQFLRRRGCLTAGTEPGDVLRACWSYLGASRAEWVLINLEDLWQELESQNTPGTTHERRNWCRRAKFSLDELLNQPEIVASLQTMQRLRPLPGKP